MDINSQLAKLREFSKLGEYKKKGDTGESVVIQALRKSADIQGSIFHSYSYPLAKDKKGIPLQGNVKSDDDGKTFYIPLKEASHSEIDVLYVSDRVIVPIECKATHQKIEFSEYWWKTNSQNNDKSPVAQCEKACRHLYPLICDLLPNGEPSYIKPLVCFIDRCTVNDNRSDSMKEYIGVQILNTVVATVRKLDEEGEFLLNKPIIIDALKERAKGYTAFYK